MKRIIKYYSNDLGITLYSDQPFEEREFLDHLGELEGIDTVEVSRYCVNASFGMLFDYEELEMLVVTLCKDFYDLTAVEQLDVQYFMRRRMAGSGTDTQLRDMGELPQILLGDE